MEKLKCLYKLDILCLRCKIVNLRDGFDICPYQENELKNCPDFKIDEKCVCKKCQGQANS